jgi:hypothetical protein
MRPGSNATASVPTEARAVTCRALASFDVAFATGPLGSAQAWRACLFRRRHVDAGVGDQHLDVAELAGSVVDPRPARRGCTRRPRCTFRPGRVGRRRRAAAWIAHDEETQATSGRSSRAAAARPRRAVGLALFTRDGCAATSPRTDLAHDIDHAFGELATLAEGVVGA